MLSESGRITLAFEGFVTAIYDVGRGIFVGRRPVTPLSFDDHDIVSKGAEGNHTLTVHAKYSSASWLEGQNSWRFPPMASSAL